MATNSIDTNFINADDYFTNSDNNLLNINLNTKENNKWNRFSEWLHCICVVTFDLELGQAMEAIYPSHITLSDQVKNNVCYLAFPDSNSGCMGDTQFHIRLRVAPSTEHTFLKYEHTKFNGSCIPTHKADAGHYWGFVYFRQIRDSRLPRGYFQKSIVLLSRLPFVNLFYNMCSLIAPKYFDEGKEVLERACDNICDWPALRAGDTISLPLLDIIYQTFIPTIHHFNTNNNNNNNNNQINNSCNNNNNNTNINNTNQSIIVEMGINNQQTNDEINLDNNIKSLASMRLSSPTSSCVTLLASPMPQVLSSVSEIDLFTSLYSVLSHVHLLWELVLTAEPIVVLADSPTSCSHMVQSLMSLISPLVFCAESRPYFTIHDSEFKEFTQFTQQNPPPSIILGVTNPFFSKTLQHWPHTIRLTLESTTTTTTTTNLNGTVTTTTVSSLSTSSASATTTIGMGGKPSTNLTYPYGNDMSTTIIGDDHQFTTKFQSKLRKIKSITSSKLLDCTPGVYTQYKSFLEKDKNVIKKILLGIKTKRPAHVQSALLRRHLLELTQSFMIPLERYMTTLMPLQRDISPFKATPTPNQFKQDDFLATIDQFGPQLTSTLKGDWIGLYKRFFRSPNFKGWYEMRYNEITKTLQALQLHALSEADLKKWVQGKHEVEIVDMILKLKQKLKLCNEIEIDNPLPTIAANGALKSETKKQIIAHLEDMNKLLPDDLRTILNNTKT